MINPQVLDSMDASTMEKRRNTLPPPPWGWDARSLVVREYLHDQSPRPACAGCPYGSQRYAIQATTRGDARCDGCRLVGWRESETYSQKLLSRVLDRVSTITTEEYLELYEETKRRRKASGEAA